MFMTEGKHVLFPWFIFWPVTSWRDSNSSSRMPGRRILRRFRPRWSMSLLIPWAGEMTCCPQGWWAGEWGREEAHNNGSPQDYSWNKKNSILFTYLFCCLILICNLILKEHYCVLPQTQWSTLSIQQWQIISDHSWHSFHRWCYLVTIIMYW